MERAITIILVDDHAMLRDGLKHIIAKDTSYQIIDEASDGLEALSKIRKLKPDLVITDISLPTMMGTDLVKSIKSEKLGCRIIVISRHDKQTYINELIKYGVDGYILKDEAGDVVNQAIKQVMAGKQFFGSKILNLVEKNKLSSKKLKDAKIIEASDFDILTKREKMITKLIAEGKTTNEVGHLLSISPSTVKVHRKNIFKKLHITNQAELVHYAIKYGLVE